MARKKEGEMTLTPIREEAHTLTKFCVNKNNEAIWHIVEAETPQQAIESYYNVEVAEYDRDGDVIVFDDVREEVDQLYTVDIR